MNVKNHFLSDFFYGVEELNPHEIILRTDEPSA
jgi:hypothetical protein